MKDLDTITIKYCESGYFITIKRLSGFEDERFIAKTDSNLVKLIRLKTTMCPEFKQKEVENKETYLNESDKK